MHNKAVFNALGKILEFLAFTMFIPFVAVYLSGRSDLITKQYRMMFYDPYFLLL